MPDNRHELMTITMTREEWDSVYRNGYSYVPWEVENAARSHYEALVKPGYEDRLAAAREEFDATVPKLTPVVKRAIAAETDRLVRAHRAGELKVDHLGHPASVLGGWAVSVTPRLQGGGPGLHFRRAGSWWFDHKEQPLSPDERAWFVELAHKVTGTKGEAWGQGPWVSVPFAL